MPLLQVHPALLAGSRVRSMDRTAPGVSSLEIAALVFFGAVAAVASAYVRLGLRIPGQSLLMAILPLALGLATVPRRFAGSVMTAGSLATAALLSGTGTHYYGTGALTGLVAIGPLLDLALARARSGWRLYLGFVLAGFGANLVAFMARGGSKLFQFDQPGTRTFEDWVSQAVVTYTLTGAMAGLVSAACWFRIQDSPPTENTEKKESRT